MRIIVIGAGHLGYIISELLSNEGCDVVVVDSDAEKLEAVRNDLDVLTIQADGTSPSFMRSRDVSGSDLVVAVTAMDEVNIIACILAKRTAFPIPLPAFGIRSFFRSQWITSRKISTSTWCSVLSLLRPVKSAVL